MTDTTFLFIKLYRVTNTMDKVGLQMTEVRYVCLSFKKSNLHLKYLKLFVGNKEEMFFLTSLLFVYF